MNTSPEYIYSELSAIELFQKLRYNYYCADQKDERSSIQEVILSGRLKAAIKRINPWINDNNLQKAYDAITGITGASLMEINEKVWELLRGSQLSLKQVVNGSEGFHPVTFIDYNGIENNDFLIINQCRYQGRYQNSVPDIMVYVNGLPLAILECKSPKAHGAWDQAYSDIEYYQKNSEKLFHFNQICAGIWQVGGKYGAISSPQPFYSVYRTNDTSSLEALLNRKPTQQDILIYSLFEKQRFLDIIRHFVLFELDEGRKIKKLPRYQQIRAANNAIKKLQKENKGGVIWHTQGSGKSLTMAYVTRKLQAPECGFQNPTVIVMTDRKDLDTQITTTFRNVGLKNVNQASSVIHLDKLLRNDYGGIITTTIQKFQQTDKDAEKQEDQTSEEESENLLIERHIKGKILVKFTKRLIEGKWVEIARDEVELVELSKKENLYVLVDEAHRSHYGFLASFMRTVLPNAKFIAFTGTPISKEDKSTLGEFYGGKYIDVYTIKESVADGATVELKYDNGIAKLNVRKEELDMEFEEKFGHLPEEKKNKLKQEALKKYALSSERINQIARHIIDHYSSKIFRDKHKAIVVCDGRKAAIRYKQAFEALRSQGYHNFESKVIITLGSPKKDEIAKGYYETLEWNRNHPEDLKPLLITPTEEIKDAVEDYKLPFGDEKDKEKSGKKKHDNTAFLIVSDMLLTGYDAPIASCLYLDKPLKEHNLLQALARVNRSGKGKKAGLVIDYYGITEYLIQALEIFDGDLTIADIVKNLSEELPKLDLSQNKLITFFKPIRIDRNYERDKYIEEAINFIEPLDSRDEFKELLNQFNKSLAIVLPHPSAMRYEADFQLFNEIKLRAKNTYPDDDELKVSKEESRMLQELIDEHLRGTGVQNLLLEPISILDKEKFKKEIQDASPTTKELKMRNNLKYTIRVGIDRNPDFFKPLAQRLEELLKQREQDQITQAQLLLAYTEIQDEIIQAQQESTSKGFVTETQRAVYDSMKLIYNGEAEQATKNLFELIKGEMEIIGWENKGQVLKDIENKLKTLLKGKLDREQAKEKAKELIGILKGGRDA